MLLVWIIGVAEIVVDFDCLDDAKIVFSRCWLDMYTSLGSRM